MKKYLLNRVLRSIFSVIMVMVLSIVLIFSLFPLNYITENDADIHAAKKYGEDNAKVKTLEVLNYYGYTDYVSQNDYCMEVAGNDSGPRYKACISRLDTNEDKQNYLTKYRKLGWEEITLTEYLGLDGTGNNNADVVTRQVVENGEYQIKEGQTFRTSASNNNEPHPDDYLYESDGKTVVTYNNMIYFQKRKNPFSIFWTWFSNILTLDHKNKVEEYKEWDSESQTYLQEIETHELVFGFYLPSDTNKERPETSKVIYQISEDDQVLNPSVVNVAIDDNTFKDYISVAGISTGIEKGQKEIYDIKVEKKYNSELKPEEGGSLEIEVIFDDDSTVNLTKNIETFIKDDIAVYVGDDNQWYIGNYATKVFFATTVKDYEAPGRPTIDVNYDILESTFKGSEVERGYKVELDEYGAPALTCRGCEHKYMIYFDNVFPYIHFNFVNVSLGESIFLDKGKDVINLLLDKQGPIITEKIEFPSGVVENNSISSFHTCTYNGNESLDQHLYNDNYTTCTIKQNQSSMMATSFIIGIFATLIAYFIGVPVGVLMARFKDRLFDKLSMVYIIIMFSVPSLAYIYFFAYLGTSIFNLDMTYEYGKISTYILPIVSLSLGSIASMMMWTRRYMIDQGNSDYVKFARAKGLSESQIFFKHTLRNAIVPIAHGIPGSIIGSVAGALVTEQIYNVPGTGKLMVNAIQKYDNWVAVGLIFFFAVLGIISMILGDIMITIVDPRISFVDTGGRK